eukprot:5589690-Pleurochrysis_carterae.AAC.1
MLQPEIKEAASKMLEQLTHNSSAPAAPPSPDASQQPLPTQPVNQATIVRVAQPPPSAPAYVHFASQPPATPPQPARKKKRKKDGLFQPDHLGCNPEPMQVASRNNGNLRIPSGRQRPILTTTRPFVLPYSAYPAAFNVSVSFLNAGFRHSRRNADVRP